jgi:hypothetical protein
MQGRVGVRPIPRLWGWKVGGRQGDGGLQADGCEPLSHEVPPWPSRKEAGIFGVSIFLPVIRLLAVVIYQEPGLLANGF